ncbi:MAG: ABC transporter substrate-binding protein [Bacteroidia bacterium]
MFRLFHFCCLSICIFILLGACNNRSSQVNRPIQVQLAAEPSMLHPLLGNDANRSLVLDFVGQSLITVNPKDGKLVPVLAEALPVVSEDGLNIAFRINPSAHWPDGKKITAEDVIFSMKALTATDHPQGQFGRMVNTISKVEASGQDVSFVMNTAEVYNIHKLSGILILDGRFYDTNNILGSVSLDSLLLNIQSAPGEPGVLDADPRIIAWNEHIASDRFVKGFYATKGIIGPYQVSNWDPGSSITLIKNPNYWGASLPQAWHQQAADSFTFRFIKDPNSLRLQLRQEALDVALQLPGQTINDSIKLETYDLQAYDNNMYTYLAFNTREGALKESSLRQAISYLMPVEDIIADQYEGRAVPVLSPVARINPEYNDTLPAYVFAPEKAEALLDQLGIKDYDGDLVRDIKEDGKTVPFSLNVSYPAGFAAADATAALFKDACSKVGLTITLEPTSFKMLGPKIMTHQFEMALLASSTYSHPYDFEQDFSRNHPGNHTGFGSAKLDSLIDAAGKALNPTTRRDLAWQIQAEVHREKPLMYLFASSQPVAIHDRLGNTKVMAYAPYVWLNGLKP